MYTLEDVRKEYDRLDKMLGIDTSGIPIKKMGGFRNYGLCEFFIDTKTGKPTNIDCIKINKLVFECCETSFFDTIRHEYAHAADIIITGDYHDHYGYWKELCKKIGCIDEAFSGTETDIYLKCEKNRNLRKK